LGETETAAVGGAAARIRGGGWAGSVSRNLSRMIRCTCDGVAEPRTASVTPIGRWSRARAPPKVRGSRSWLIWGALMKPGGSESAGRERGRSFRTATRIVQHAVTAIRRDGSVRYHRRRDAGFRGAGALTVRENGRCSHNPGRLRQVLEQSLDKTLSQLESHAIFANGAPSVVLNHQRALPDSDQSSGRDRPQVQTPVIGAASPKARIISSFGNVCLAWRLG
jgi:hypothetical protein